MTLEIINIANCVGISILLVFILMIANDYLESKKGEKVNVRETNSV